jgi:creatinine amidohydrolase
MSNPLRWADLTWEEVDSLRRGGMDMVLLPVGSTEQHGPHLPLNVDTMLAEAVTEAVSASTGVPVLPVLPYGCALGHTRRWPGTISLSPGTLTQVVVEVLEDVIAFGFTRVLVLSGHVTNAAPLRCALEILRDRHQSVRIAQKHLLEASARTKAAYLADADDFHANAAETALMMHLCPGQVREDRIFDDPDRTEGLVFSYTVPYTSKAGHTGRPSEATPSIGAELFDMLVEDWTDIVLRALREEPPLVPG